MFLLVLRRYRAQIWVLAALTLVVSAVFGLHGLGVDHPPGPGGSGVTDGEPGPAQTSYMQLSGFLPYLLIVPALVGAFWGAPLVSRELELRTARFVWAQAVSRRRWFGWYAGLLSSILVLCSAVLGTAISWWLERFAGHGFPGVGDDPGLLPLRGAAVTGWWLLAFGVGTLAGALLRRTLAAMGATVTAVFVLMFVAQTVQVDLLVGDNGLGLHPSTAGLVIFGTFSLTAALLLLGSWLVVRRTTV